MFEAGRAPRYAPLATRYALFEESELVRSYPLPRAAQVSVAYLSLGFFQSLFRITGRCDTESPIRRREARPYRGAKISPTPSCHN